MGVVERSALALARLAAATVAEVSTAAEGSGMMSTYVAPQLQDEEPQAAFLTTSVD